VSVRIRALEPERTWARPGHRVRVVARLVADAPARGRLQLELLDVRRVAIAWDRPLRLEAGETMVRLHVTLPTRGRRGYALRVRPVVDGAVGAWRTVVLEALAGWWEAPRHLALTDFGTASDAGAQVAAARRWHVTVMQAYDWMYRHYRYAAPEEPFTDALGRRVSHDAVRALVRAGHGTGIATLAYGSVYGAEPEHVARHPDERVFDEAGDPLSLGGAFFINDVRPGSTWRARLLREYERACRRFGFDGIHMDTYGPPHEAVAADGTRLRFAALYPGLIAEAARRVSATGRDRRVLFNCVEGFPLDAVGDAPSAAHYLELWPPDDSYTDVVRWIDRARLAGPGKAVVIAAYVPAMREAGADPAARAAALETAVTLTSVIGAAGAFHHTLAEHDRLLVEGYYPEAVRLRRAEVRELRPPFLFMARYLHLISDERRRVVRRDDLEVRDAEGDLVPLSIEPVAGAVWIRSTETPAGPVISLVDLRSQADDRWTVPRQAVESARGWTVTWPGFAAPVAMSPWARGGAAVVLRAATSRDATWRLPTFRRWLVLHDPAPGT
jgi:dextranase